MSLSHRFPVRVYYEDTDFSGVVYHANYLRFLERGRTEFLRDCGVDQAALFGADPPVAFAVRRMMLDFRAAARMDDHLMVETRVMALGGASITMHQALHRDADVLLEADVRIALVSQGRAVRLPAPLRARLERAVRPETERR